MAARNFSDEEMETDLSFQCVDETEPLIKKKESAPYSLTKKRYDHDKTNVGEGSRVALNVQDSHDYTKIFPSYDEEDTELSVSKKGSLESLKFDGAAKTDDLNKEEVATNPELSNFNHAVRCLSELVDSLKRAGSPLAYLGGVLVEAGKSFKRVGGPFVIVGDHMEYAGENLMEYPLSVGDILPPLPGD